MPIRLGRMEVEYHRRALHFTRNPDPNCPDCSGRRGHGWIIDDGEVDWDECQCVDQLRTWRLPLWPSRPYSAEEPF
jgi:hypothetical protein